MRPRVLIADPDDLMLAAYEAFLAGEGFLIQTVSTALDCLTALREAPPDLLVIDPDLPWGSGMGVLVLMEQEPDLPCVPAIILARQIEPVLHKGPLLREYAILLKPTSPGIVAAAIRQILSEKQSDRRLHMVKTTGDSPEGKRCKEAPGLVRESCS